METNRQEDDSNVFGKISIIEESRADDFMKFRQSVDAYYERLIREYEEKGSKPTL